MFTGIIEDVGEIKEISYKSLVVKTSLDGINIGDSIAVNGICLTVVEVKKISTFYEFYCDISFETFSRTNLKFLRLKDKVNLERALKLNSRLNGHIVTGHIDTIVKLEKIEGENFYFSLPSEYEKYVVEKGSVALDGISLTVAYKRTNVFCVSVIPFTLNNTNLKYKKLGDFFNLEVDILAKYVENFFNNKNKKSDLSLEFLKEHGFD